MIQNLDAAITGYLRMGATPEMILADYHKRIDLVNIVTLIKNSKIKVPVPEFIHFNSVDDKNNYVFQTVEPFNLGKVVKIMDQGKALDFSKKQVTYSIVKLKGVNIFLVFGNEVDPGTQKRMANYYLSTITTKYILKRYETKTDTI
jgi:hypothetical protein